MRDYLLQLRDRLLELGCPVWRVRRMVRELADHREDLVESSVAEGCSKEESEVMASRQLGDPELLADKLMASARQATWWGRHAFTAFCLVPLLVFPFIWGALFYAGLWTGFALEYHLNWHAVHKATDDPTAFYHGMIYFYTMDLLAVALTTALFYWLSRRSAVNLRWTLIAGLVCCMYASFTWVYLRPHSVSAGFSYIPNWQRTLVPLLVLGLAQLWHWRSVRNFRRQAVV